MVSWTYYLSTFYNLYRRTCSSRVEYLYTFWFRSTFVKGVRENTKSPFNAEKFQTHRLLRKGKDQGRRTKPESVRNFLTAPHKTGCRTIQDSLKECEFRSLWIPITAGNGFARTWTLSCHETGRDPFLTEARDLRTFVKRLPHALGRALRFPPPIAILIYL